jgi:hypothetical protein
MSGIACGVQFTLLYARNKEISPHHSIKSLLEGRSVLLIRYLTAIHRKSRHFPV